MLRNLIQYIFAYRGTGEAAIGKRLLLRGETIGDFGGNFCFFAFFQKKKALLNYLVLVETPTTHGLVMGTTSSALVQKMTSVL